jgi:long-chain-acyl-CoA dehydrogenase
MVSGEAITAIAMTEPGAGSDLQACAPRPKRDGNHYVVNGLKTYITNGQNADLIIVVAKTDPTRARKGISLILVEADPRGLQARAATWTRSASTRPTPRSCSSRTCACR